MSIEAINAVRVRRFGSANRKAVMYVLADYSDAHWSCYVGQRRLSAEAEVGERTVRRMLAELEAEGIIRREPRHDGQGWRTSDRIYLSREAIEALPANMAARSDLPANEGDLAANPTDLPAKSDTPTGQALAAKPLGEPLGVSASSTDASGVEQPSFDGRDVYAYHAALIGFASTAAQLDLLDKYVQLASGDYALVGECMGTVPNPHRLGWLGEVGDLIRETMDARRAKAEASPALIGAL